jgi:uncharacterized protein YndB with AHSA1/START domain
MSRGDKATVSVRVDVALADAFIIFTEEVDLWWRRGAQYRMGGRSPGVLQFEAGVGGRLFERFDDHVIEMGRITAWQPPTLLEFDWRNRNFAPDEKTHVTVRFEPSGAGTLVTVEHAGWAALRPGHPARHDLEGSAFSAMIGRWWGDILSGLRESVGVRAPR